MIATAIPSPVSASAHTAPRRQLRLARPGHQPEPAWHAGFLKLLPAIQHQAHRAFRRLPREAREEAVAEVIAHAVVAYARLVELGKEDLAYSTPLARFGIARTRCGRRVGGRRSVRDVSSACCRHRNGVVIERIGDRKFDERSGEWREIVVEDRRTRPAEVAATRIDFTSWLATLSRRDRKVAEALAIGEPTISAARMFRVSSARISQLRRSFFEAWQEFHGELGDGPALATA